MINLHMRVRPAAPQDHRQISSLIHHEINTHRHLDWRTALEWLGEPNYWVLEENGNILAALACPEDPQNIAWIRLFTTHSHLSGGEAWSALWKVAQAEIYSVNSKAQVASIVMKQWFQTILLQSGFEPALNIVLLELRSETYRPISHSKNIPRIRPMREADLAPVTQVDLAAFGPFWHNSIDALKRAREQSFSATVAETEEGIIGYQMSTGSPFGAHLARLCVLPASQGRGVASSLIDDLIQNDGALRSGRLSVNTQDTNTASLSLYGKLGFTRTGEYFPVLTHSAENAQ